MTSLRVIKNEVPDHISYSGLSTWNQCPYRFKLTRIDKIKEPGNIFFAFGTAVHDSCEYRLLKEALSEECLDDVLQKRFTETFDRELKELPEGSYTEKDREDFLNAGLEIVIVAYPALRKQFGKFKVVVTEEELKESLPQFKQTFVGYIDLIIQTEDGKYHILDWKTTSWGWDAKKKSDAMTTYQLTLYKDFWTKKHGIDPKNVETHFALLKRVLKKNGKKEDRVEVFRVTSGPKKTTNALNLLERSLYNINKKFYPKNRMNCNNCSFNRTEYCKR